MAVRHSANKFEGWEPQVPVPTFIRESKVSVLTSEALSDPDTGMLCSSMSMKIRLHQDFVPEKVNVIIAEPFEGIDLKIAIGRLAGRHGDETFYLDWTDANEVELFHQNPAKTFLEPGGNGDVVLNLRVVGETPPTSGLIYYFIKSRKKWQ